MLENLENDPGSPNPDEGPVYLPRRQVVSPGVKGHLRLFSLRKITGFFFVCLPSLSGPSVEEED